MLLKKISVVIIMVAMLVICTGGALAAPEKMQSTVKRVSPAKIARGKLLFNANGCRDCHFAQGQGCRQGPLLDGIGSKRSRAFLLGHLLDPEGHVGKHPEAFFGDESMMPLPNLSQGEAALIADYLASLKAAGKKVQTKGKTAGKTLGKAQGKSAP